MIKARPSAASISVNFRTQGSQKPMQVVNPAFEPSCPSDTFSPQVSRKNTWWRHQMETFSALLAVCEGNSSVRLVPLPAAIPSSDETVVDQTGVQCYSSVTDEFPSQRPVTRRFDVFFDLCPQQTAEQTIETPVVWDTIIPIMTSL